MTDPLRTAVRSVIDADVASVVVPPVTLIQRRARRRRQASMTAAAAGLAAVAATGGVLLADRGSGRPATVAAGGQTSASVEVREVLEAAAPNPAGVARTAPAAFSTGAFADSSCPQPTAVPDQRVAVPDGPVIACAVDGSEILHLAGVGLSDADVTGAVAENTTLTLQLASAGQQRLNELTRAAVGKRIAFLVNGVVVSSPTVQAPFGTAQLQLPQVPNLSKIADAINASHGD